MQRYRKYAAILAVPLICSCASFSQQADEVWVRHGTDGRLKMWKKLPEASQEHWPYAWASLAAYQRPNKEPSSRCPADPGFFLEDREWHRWNEVPDIQATSALGQQMVAVHLRVRVYANKASNAVIIAFGGTDGMGDMVSNMRWFQMNVGSNADQYKVLFGTFVPAFLDIWRSKIKTPEDAWMRTAEFVSTGHSLGGGLAQGFAYAAAIQGLPIRRVVAFNSSPVSGKRDLPWRKIAREMKIDRIYNRGEILAAVRGTFNALVGPGKDNATFTDYRYALSWKWHTPFTVVGAVRSHFLRPLACVMAEEAQLLDRKVPNQLGLSEHAETVVDDTIHRGPSD
jgi:hypothetical protein